MVKIIRIICCEPSASEYLNELNKIIHVEDNNKNREMILSRGDKRFNNEKNYRIEKIYNIKNKSQISILLNEVSEVSNVVVQGLKEIAKKGGSELASKNTGNKDEKKYYLVVDGEGKAHIEIKKAIVTWKKSNEEDFNRIKNNTYLVINNPCLEYYFLLHFQNKHLSCASANDMIKELQRYWKEYNKTPEAIMKKIKELDDKYKDFKKNINSCESFLNDNKKGLESIYNTSIGNILNKDDSFWKELLPFTNMGKLVDEYIKKQSKKA